MLRRRPLWWATARATQRPLLGYWFAVRVPPGLPYDEPAHWVTVLYYASDHPMPVPGDPSVAYGAQTGPVHYALSALFVDTVGSSDGPRTFTLLRCIGVALVPTLTLLTYRLGWMLHDDPTVADTASAFVAVKPVDAPRWRPRFRTTTYR